MKLGDVLRIERERKKFDPNRVSAEMGLTVEEYMQLESGSSQIEDWGPKLAEIAIRLGTPTSRLISRTGKSSGARQETGQCGNLIKAQRESHGLSREELANKLNWPVDEIISIEEGQSPLENIAPLLLRFAEVVDQPVFNLFYPCGLPFQSLESYP
jgi:transcriptional regulator with XRE-family HTH domain